MDPGPSHSRRPSQGNSQAGGRAGSPSGGPPRSRRPSVSNPQLSAAGSSAQGQFPPGIGYDPARAPLDEAKRRAKEMPSRIDLPADAYSLAKMSTPYARRPGYNTVDKPVNLRINQYRVEQATNIKVFQYAFSVKPEPLKSVVYKKCWASHKFQQRLEKYSKAWLYDGRNLVWSINDMKDPIQVEIDLDEEKGRVPRPGSEGDKQFIILKQTSTIYLSSLIAYLRGTASWDTHVLECMNFFDHALRQKPSQYMTAIRRNFYHPSAPRRDLDGVVYAAKGIYAAFRLSESIKTGGSGLGINVDVANTTFWKEQTLDNLVMRYLDAAGEKWRCSSHLDAVNLLRPVQSKFNQKLKEAAKSDAFISLRKLHKLRFKVLHRGKMNDEKVYSIARFAWDSKYQFEGATAKNVTFLNKKTGETRSICDHYMKQYDIPLRYPNYPVVETFRDGSFPLEVCHILPWQRYPFKLTPAQTSDMIRFAVTRPAERSKSIADNVNKLGWGSDEYLRDFGIRVNPNMTQVQGRLLQAPSVAYKNGVAKPGTTGRWDLRQKVLHINNKDRPLASWGFVVVDNCVDMAAASNFIRVFTKTYKDHGGLVAKPPHITRFPRDKPLDEVYFEAYNATVNANGGQHPVMMFFVLPNKNAFSYYRLKKSGECRFGMVSQMLASQHVLKAQPQYCSNVCMKVNAKLGGTTCRIPKEGNPTRPAFFEAPTMVIGVDVSHGTTNLKGDLEPSMAAMTVSWDRDAAKYAAFCQTNGYRTEIISPLKMQSMFNDALTKWREALNCRMPEHVYYFRDGVSEGEFGQVMDFEIAEIRKIFRERCGQVPKFTVIIATKRHHIRFFPDGSSGDRNGNPLPGTVVEREVTHPFHYDFYLCPHVAIQGTARPVHYHVIHDEIKLEPHKLQKMIYQQCYQYARSTTSVSLHPAVYYAHLAGDRARSHQDIQSEKKDPVHIQKMMSNWTAKNTSSNQTHPTEAPPLLPFGTSIAADMNKQFTPYTMWFI